MAAPFASAQTIDFGGLTGFNGDDVVTYVEDGFTVTDTTASGLGWVEGQVFGNGVPSLFSNSAPASISVANGGTFSFVSVDLADALASPTTIDFVIEGFLGGGTVFSDAGSFTGLSQTFATVNSSSSADIDLLTITFTDLTTSVSFNIDNIVLGDANSNPVPAPAALPAGIALLGMLGFRRKNRAA